MSEIASRLNQTSDIQYYLDVAQNYSNTFIVEGMSQDQTHMKLAYQEPDSSWSTLYNLYPDKLLNYSLFPATLYDMQASWYQTVNSTYGVPLDSRNGNVKSDFEIMMAAAFVCRF